MRSPDVWRTDGAVERWKVNEHVGLRGGVRDIAVGYLKKANKMLTIAYLTSMDAENGKRLMKREQTNQYLSASISVL